MAKKKYKKSDKSKESELKELKKEYERLQKRHSLPSFEKLNEDFQIERIAEIETEHLDREVRKMMADKFSNYLRFIETLVNPVNAPMFVFSFVKTLTNEEKRALQEIYRSLVRIELMLIKTDTAYSEKQEVSFIKDAFKEWQEIKDNLLKVLEQIEKNLDNKSENNNKGYFG